MRWCSSSVARTSSPDVVGAWGFRWVGERLDRRVGEATRLREGCSRTSWHTYTWTEGQGLGQGLTFGQKTSRKKQINTPENMEILIRKNKGEKKTSTREKKQTYLLVPHPASSREVYLRIPAEVEQLRGASGLHRGGNPVVASASTERVAPAHFFTIS